MKNIHYVAVLFISSLFSQPLLAQDKETVPINNSGWHFSARGGYDFPSFYNNTPYIVYRGGLELGASVDYYWKWIGIGGDFDYIDNHPKNKYPTQNLIYHDSPVAAFGSRDPITRIFYGIGPSFKYQKNNKFSAELKLRAGLASIKGGRTNLDGIGQGTNAPVALNFHTGYNRKNQFSVKGSVQFNYFISPSFGFHVGSYYLEHFKVRELVDPALGITSGYREFSDGVKDNLPVKVVAAEQNLRKEPCDCEVHSVGVYAGITYRISKNPKPEKKKAPIKIYSLTVIAKDKYTLELLPNSAVVVKNAKGEIVQKGTTNEVAEIKFDSIAPDNYTIEGLYADKPMDGSTTLKKEFLPTESLRKIILYSDLQFLFKGKVVDSQTRQPLDQVSATPTKGTETMTDAEGKFKMPIYLKDDNPVYLKKDGYFSKTEKVPTESFDRKKSLFIDVTFGLEKFDCGKAIKLENIHYDLDKFFIREDAKPELDKLVRFLNDNPGVKVELSSHTDCRASSKYNNKLSQNRANAAVDYIVSQGIDRSRLTGKGYGETKLLNKCADKVYCSEADHQLNRRTEMKVICPQ
jgi:outer membrane protein OmpA-like peptidoglycan-associated protein